MKITYFDNPYELSDGRFLAQFNRVEEYHNQKARGKDGLPIPPGYKWVFVIAEGPDSGKEAALLTGKIPSAKNSLGRLIMAMTDGNIADGFEFDAALFVGAWFRITIKEGYMTDAPPPKFLGMTKPVPPRNTPPEELETGTTRQRDPGDTGDEIPY